MMQGMPDLVESWAIARDYLALITNVDQGTLRIDALQRLWQNKWDTLGKFFGPDGRIYSIPEAGSDRVLLWSDEDTVECLDAGNDFALSVAPKYKLGPMIAAKLNKFLVTWLAVHFSPAAVRDNRTEKGRIGSLLRDTLFRVVQGVDDPDLDEPTRELCQKLLKPDEENRVAFLCLVHSRLVELMKPLGAEDCPVVLSINPLDVLLQASHTSTPGSCHKLKGGAAATGPIAYLGDAVTAVAFACGRWGELEGTAHKLPVKVWRQLVYLDLQNLVAVHSRHYPHTNPVYGHQARVLSAGILAQQSNRPPKGTVSSSKSIAPGTPDADVPDTQLFDIHASNWLYMDKHAYYSGVRLQDTQGQPSLYLGSPEIPCLKCAKARQQGENRDRLLCNPCKADHLCCFCSNPLREPALWFEGTGPFCRQCLTAMVLRCSDCGVEYLRGHGYRLQNGRYLCGECYGNYRTCAACMEVGRDFRTLATNGRTYCPRCWQNHVGRCLSCGGEWTRAEMRYDSLCPACTWVEEEDEEEMEVEAHG